MRSPVIELSPNGIATNSNLDAAGAIEVTGTDNDTENLQPSTCDVGTDAGFIGVKRNHVQTKRFFLSGIAQNVNKDMILQYLLKKGVNLTLVNVFSSKQNGTLCAKFNFRAVDSKQIQEDDFWPEYVRWRPWLYKQRFQKQASVSWKKANTASNDKTNGESSK